MRKIHVVKLTVSSFNYNESTLNAEYYYIHCEAEKKEPIFFSVHVFQYFTETGNFSHIH